MKKSKDFKVCTKCKKNKRAKNQRWCQQCKTDYQRDWLSTRVLVLIDELCPKCRKRHVEDRA